MRHRPWPERAFRALLRLFPSEFRGDFGDDMAEDFRDQRTDARESGGRPATARLWLRTLVDTIRRAPAERLDILRRDGGYAVRLLRRRPGLAASALLTLAIGIGVNTAVFSLAYHVLWRPLPLADSDRLVNLEETDLRSAEGVAVSAPNFLDWQARTRAVNTMAIVASRGEVIIDGGNPEELLAADVSREFFGMVHARPALGRLFDQSDFAAMAHQLETRAHAYETPTPATVVLSYELWQRRFHSSPDVIGRTVRLGGHPVQIVGVSGPETGYPYPAGWPPGRSCRRSLTRNCRSRSMPSVPVTSRRSARIYRPAASSTSTTRRVHLMLLW